MAEVSAMVDTGAAHTMMPESLLQQLHVEPRAQRHFLLADGSGASYGYGIARIALAGQEWPCPVIFGPESNIFWAPLPWKSST